MSVGAADAPLDSLEFREPEIPAAGDGDDISFEQTVGDVDEFTARVRTLLNDKKLRTKMGEAGREETLKWNWKAATSVLRNLQYTRAERHFAERMLERAQRHERIVGWITKLWEAVGGAPAPPALRTMPNASGFAV